MGTESSELSVTQAIAKLVEGLQPVHSAERVAVRDAAGRVLAESLISRLDLPSFDNAAMDGYAIRAADCRDRTALREIGRALAGHAFAGTVEPGTCVRIMTGAPLPDGADTVVMMEDINVAGGRVSVQRTPATGANIRRCGEHVRAGEVVLPAGKHLRAADIGLATAIGATEVEVKRRLRVGVASTGDELADPPQPLTGCAAYDANRPFLLASAFRLGFESVDLGICVDRGEAFDQLLDRAFVLGLDALVISGGAAQGDADVVRRAGGIAFLPLDIRPGRGVAFAFLQREEQKLALLGLPGNAVAAFVMFHLVARPALLHMAGAPAVVPAHVPLPLACDVQIRGGRIDYRRARLLNDAGHVAVMPLKEQGSAMLRTVSDADVLLAIGPRSEYRAGEMVPAVLLAALD